MYDPAGIRMPLCNDCLAPDCSNPIRERTVSVMGVPQKMRLYVVNNVVKQVIACNGYVGKDNASISSIKESVQKPATPIGRNFSQSQSNSSSFNDEEKDH